MVAPYVDIVELPGGDYAGDEHLVFSPKILEQMVKPALELLIRPIKARRGDLLAPANHLQTDVPPENIVALFQAARVV